MRTIKNIEDLNLAILQKEETISVEDNKLAKTLILAYRVENGYIPDVVVSRIISGNSCNVAVGEGIVFRVDSTLMQQADTLRCKFNKLNIEMDVVEVTNTQINLFYGQTL